MEERSDEALAFLQFKKKQVLISSQIKREFIKYFVILSEILRCAQDDSENMILSF